VAGLVDRIAGYQFEPSTVLVLATGVVALGTVAIDGVWRWTRNVITIVHEAGHALAALLTGRRLTGIRLHSDTSGLTLSVGRPDGAGMVLTAAAGYISPSLLGLCGVAVLAAGWVTVALWVTTGLLLAMLFMIRNGYGVLSVLVTGAAVGLVAWYASADTQAAFGHAVVWFLLLGGVRPVAELRRQRRAGYARNSDADQLARLTRLPAPLWVFLFGLGSLAALAGGGWLLLR
jgi:hypothetical protein